jgi:predicted short-subunit dehydrogenase-like oxidoreductase (DUF2520 family)
MSSPLECQTINHRSRQTRQDSLSGLTLTHPLTMSRSPHLALFAINKYSNTYPQYPQEVVDNSILSTGCGQLG